MSYEVNVDRAVCSLKYGRRISENPNKIQKYGPSLTRRSAFNLNK
jgi:hypothetical protein